MPAPQSPIAVSLIAAVDRQNGIGRANDLLVRLPEDLRHFKQTTMGAPIAMGRKTWDSIGRPLPGRQNIVVTRNPGWRADGAQRAASIDEAIVIASSAGPAQTATAAGRMPKLYVIGGAEIYALAMPLAQELVLTELDASFEADTFFPPWPRHAFHETSREHHRSAQGLAFAFVTYQRN